MLRENLEKGNIPMTGRAEAYLGSGAGWAQARSQHGRTGTL